MNKIKFQLVVVICFCLLKPLTSLSQAGNFSASDLRNMRNVQPQKDTLLLKHRDPFEDSITVYYHFFDRQQLMYVDSTLNDYSLFYPYHYTGNSLGNLGNAYKSFIFSPSLKAGWDHGFHAFDHYNFTVDNTKFYSASRPYSNVSYLLGSNAEQLVDFFHTQNKGSSFNFSLEYRFTNSSGAYANQNANLNNFRFTANQTSTNKRYAWQAILVSNKNASSENGGLQNTKLIDSLSLNDPFELPVKLNSNGIVNRNPFNTKINTGNIYDQTTIYFRHHYDFGEKDSTKVNDSVTIKLFYPRLRIEHNLQWYQGAFNFFTATYRTSNDSLSFTQYFGFYDTLRKAYDTKDKWQNIRNELSVLTFPDKKNASQFLKLGTSFETMHGSFTDKRDSAYSIPSKQFYNIEFFGVYRNKTKNQKWYIEANGKIFANGINSGDYETNVQLQRFVTKQLHPIKLWFSNSQKSPSMLMQQYTSFWLNKRPNLNKENILVLGGQFTHNVSKINVSASYYVVNNLFYFDSFFSANQYKFPVTLLHISAEKKIRLAKKFNWYIQAHIQQSTGDAPINIPFLLVNNKLVFEGQFFKNLQLATGIESRWYTAYSPSNYSPFLGQFMYQNQTTTQIAPEVHLFLHFRIRTFKGFLRVENLNTYNFKSGLFNQYNFHTPNYGNPGLWLRGGLVWTFIN